MILRQYLQHIKTNLKELEAKSSLYIYFFQGGSVLLTLLLTILIARWGGVYAKGQFDLFHLFVTLIQDLGFLGLGSGLLAVYTTKKTPMGQVHGTGLIMALVCGLGLMGIAIPTVHLWEVYFSGVPRFYLLASLALCPFMFYKLVWSNLALGLGMAKHVHALVFISHMAIVLGLVGAKLVWGFGVEQAFQLYFVSYIVSAPVYYWLMKKPQEHGPLKVNQKVSQSALGVGLALYLGLIFNLLHFKADQLMINYFLSTEDVGIYALSSRLSEGLFLIENGIVAATWAKVMNPGGSIRLSLFKKVVLVQAGLTLLAVMGLFLLGGFLIVSLWGHDFQAAILPLQVLLPGVWLWSISKLFANYLVFKKGKAQWVTLFAGMGFIMNIGLNYLFLAVYGWGVVSVAVASALSYALVAILVALSASYFLKQESAGFSHIIANREI